MQQSGLTKIDDDVLSELADVYSEAARKDVSELEAQITAILEDRSFWETACKELRRIVHNVKGQGSSFGYPLMTEIGDSLSLLLKMIEELHEPQLKLIEAHVTAMRLVIEQGIKGNGGEQGRLLVSRLRELVEKLTPNS